MYTTNSAYSWERLAAGGTVDVYPVGPIPEKATLVEFKDREKDARYDEYIQGEREMFVIFRVGDRYFKKFGEKSSYGDESWDGKCIEVFPKEVTIKVFEDKE